MAQFSDLQLAENILRFNPKWWWDPVPPWLSEHLTVELARDFTRVQLEKHSRILQAELEAAKETMNLLDRIR